jgi:hypothetical protein
VSWTENLLTASQLMCSLTRKLEQKTLKLEDAQKILNDYIKPCGGQLLEIETSPALENISYVANHPFCRCTLQCLKNDIESVRWYLWVIFAYTTRYDFLSELLCDIERMLKGIEDKLNRYIINSQVSSQSNSDDYVLSRPAAPLLQARLIPQPHSGGAHNARRLGEKAPDPKGVGFMSRI